MTAAAPRADEGAERSKPHLLHGVFDSDGLTRFRLECPYEVKGVLPAGRRCWSLDDDGEIDSLQCFAKGWVDERGAELISFEITDPSFPIEVDVELHGLLQTPNLTLHVRSASSGDGGAPTRAEIVTDAGRFADAYWLEDLADMRDQEARSAPGERTSSLVGDRFRSIAACLRAPAAPSPVPEEGPQPLNLDAVQAQVDTWTRQFRPTPEAAADPMADALCIAEEAGEVCRAVLKRSHGKRPDVDWSAQLRDEVGDVVIGLLSLAANEGWSLADAVTERWAEVSQRGATPEQGEGPGK